jgi:hypothetical protein
MGWTQVATYPDTRVTVYQDGEQYKAVKTGLTFAPALVQAAIMDADRYDEGVQGNKIKYVGHARVDLRFSPTDVVYTQALSIPFFNNPTVVRMQVLDAADAGQPDYLEIGWGIYCLGAECRGKDPDIDSFLEEYGTKHLNPNDGKWMYQKQTDGTYTLTQILHTDLGVAGAAGAGPSTLAGNVNGMTAFISAHGP